MYLRGENARKVLSLLLHPLFFSLEKVRFSASKYSWPWIEASFKKPSRCTDYPKTEHLLHDVWLFNYRKRFLVTKLRNESSIIAASYGEINFDVTDALELSLGEPPEKSISQISSWDVMLEEFCDEMPEVVSESKQSRFLSIQDGHKDKLTFARGCYQFGLRWGCLEGSSF